jgi:hypothetical protein
LVLLLGATSLAQTCSQIAEQIAKAYGLDSFGQIDAIRYTFNIQFPGVNVPRSLVWEPKTGQVSYEGKDKDGKPLKAPHVRSQLGSQSEAVRNEIDPASTMTSIGWSSLSMFTGTTPPGARHGHA